MTTTSHTGRRPQAEAGGAPENAAMPQADAGARFLSRDLSWLEFNARVLAQAWDERVPLLERVRFLAIFTNNLDEFVQNRIGLLKRMMGAAITAPFPDGFAPQQAFGAVRARIVELQLQQAECFERRIRPALAAEGILLIAYADLSPAERVVIDTWFRANVYPCSRRWPSIRPQVPFISNLSRTSKASMVSRPDDTDRHFARIKIPDVLPRLVRIDELRAWARRDLGSAAGLRLVNLQRSSGTTSTISSPAWSSAR